MTASARTARISTRTRTVQAWPVGEAPTTPSVDPSHPTPTPPPFVAVDTAQLPGVGQTVGGHCVLRKLLGEGAFGRVFAAEHEETGQQVALKVVGLRRYPREYAEHELRALASIAHPNVVQLNEHGVEASAAEPYLWYTMPLYKGSDLARVLKAEGPLSLARAHAVFSRIAGGLCELHRAGLRHQDIKPDNIYLAAMAGVGDRHPVLLDLGGAARKGSSRPLVATFPFAAPEQTEALIGGLLGDKHEPLSEKVDVYALGATLLFSLIGPDMLGHDVGQSEEDGETSPAALVKLRSQLAVIHAMRAEDPLPQGALAQVTGSTREHLRSAFQRWLAPDPALRSSAVEFLDELSVLLEWDAEVARREAARATRNTVLGVTLGLSLAVSVGLFAGYQWHKRTMSAANQATNEALKKADEAADELNRAGSNLDKIVADPALGPVEKAKKIGEVVESLEAQTSGLAAANAQLKSDAKRAAEIARFRAQQEKEKSDAAIAKANDERDQAEQAKSAAESARVQAENERNQARSDKAAADAARANAERDRDRAQQDKVASDAARAKAEQDQAAADAARQKAEAERDKAIADKAAAAAAAFARGVAARITSAPGTSDPAVPVAPPRN
ncbi:MAG TPA: protein kinase [Polyangiaceae bacterium]|nr:protein kinase [Polyangiaceae bacterium]